MEETLPYIIGVVILVSLILLLRKAFKYADKPPALEESGREMEPFIGDYLRKIILLEKQIGAKVGYKSLEPFWVPGTQLGDILKLQGVAKEIADFVGLGGLTFVVSITKQRANVAGRVELNYSGNNVFVEISDDMRKFEDAIVATLAHEITHKYMQINGISSGTGLAHEYENEVLTDITAIFLGLGKLMLNGTGEEKTHREEKIDGTHYVTETRRCGYLSRQQLAFVYRLIFAMRGVSKRDMLSNLSPAAKNAVLYCNREYQDYFDPKFQTDNFRDEVMTTAMKGIDKAVGELDRANELLGSIEEACLHRTKAFLQAKQEKITDLQNDLESLKQDDIYDPCLKFLNSIQLKERAIQIRGEAQNQNLDTAKVIKKLKKLKAKIEKQKYPSTE